MPDLRDEIKTALRDFNSKPLRKSALTLLDILGYRSDRTLVLEGSKPHAFLDLVQSQPAATKFDSTKALFSDWKSADILFQLTDDDLASTSSLFKETNVKPGLLRSYLFFAIELTGSDYARGRLSAIARQINRVFPMPVMVFLKHGRNLSIAVINRRQNKVHGDKDVLEKVTLIRDISLITPHRGHQEILASFAFKNLTHPKKLPIQDFDTLHAAWEQIFNIELLNKRFYEELSNWYFWALPQVKFPNDTKKDSEEKHQASSLIRLLTRLIFCWFLKEKDGLIPEKLFHLADLSKILKGFDPESETSSTYYQAILQNLFFATLNQRMGKDAKGQPYRRYVTKEKYQGKNKEHGVTTLFRYPEHFTQSDTAVDQFADIPFLNGGLFECLDREDPNDKNRMLRLDGFTTDGKRPHVPDRLFFDSGETADLSREYGDTKRKAEKVTGLITILNRYKFTIVENTPIDQEIALDPELLGKVFENLLASYNEETKTTARKQTGSFYTPRPIVDYMVDESLKAHLTRCLTDQAGMKENDAKVGLDLLFTYTEEKHSFSDKEVAALIANIDALKILDPACGSGAFPMGVLHKLVYILGKLDPDNDRWKQTQLAKLDSAPMREELERAFADNNDDYGRKLYLIENCLYGVDIQAIAIQITKLRFFISLVCDQKTNRSKKDNHGVRPLPNLETKFVAADTLVGLPDIEDDLYRDGRIALIEKEIETLYHCHFSIQRRDQKLAIQKKIKSLRHDLTTIVSESLSYISSAKSKHLADWDPFDPQLSADFFDPHWMFGRALIGGFDIIIGNPPYISYYSRHSQTVDTDYLSRLISQAVFTKEPLAGKRYHTAMFFLDRAAILAEKNGVVAFIVDMNLFENVFAGIRQSLLKSTRISGIVRGLSHFENVNSGQVIIIFSNSTPCKDDCFQLKNSLDDTGTPVSQNACLVDEQCRFVLPCGKKSFADCFPLAELGTVSTGVNIGGASKAFLSPTNEAPEFLPFISTTTIKSKYQKVIHHGEFIRFSQLLVESINSNNRASGSKNVVVLGNVGRFKGEKILIRQSAPAIIATYDDQVSVTPYSIFVFKINSEKLKSYSISYILAVLNSNLITHYALTNQIIRTGEGKQPQIRKAGLDTIPIKKPTAADIDLFGRLVPLIQYAKSDSNVRPGATAFLEDLIDACVMECYFREHMELCDLLFHDAVAPHLAAYTPNTNGAKQRDFVQSLHSIFSASTHPISNRLLRLAAESSDLLAMMNNSSIPQHSQTSCERSHS